MYNFRRLSKKFRTIFWSLIFHISLPSLGSFSHKKGNLNFSVLKMWWRKESEEFSLSKYVKLHLKFSGKWYWNTSNSEKTQVPLGWPCIKDLEIVSSVGLTGPYDKSNGWKLQNEIHFSSVLPKLTELYTREIQLPNFREKQVRK